MQVTYKTDRRSKQEYLVSARVQLTPEEEALGQDPGFYSKVQVGERYAEQGDRLRIKGVDISGNVDLQDLRQGREYKFRSIHNASDFAESLMEGLRNTKKQIEAARASMAALGQTVTLDI